MNIADIFNQDTTWISTDPPTSTRNNVLKMKNSAGEIAFFKAPKPHISANEVLAYLLATELGLACAKIKFAKLIDENKATKNGVLSYKVSGFEPVEWDLVSSDIRQNLKKYVMNYNDLPKIAVFDTWTYNLDRGSTGNLILGRKEEWPKKFTVYMIDHEECFYGLADNCNRDENDGNWFHANTFIKISEIRDTIKLSLVESFISQIEAITDQEINEFVSYIPEEYYNSGQANIVKSLLIKRKQQLRKIITDWCNNEKRL